MRIKISKVIYYIIFAIIGLGLLFFVFKDIDLAEMWQNIITVNFWWIFVALILGIGGYIFRTLRWNLLIESSCKKTPEFKKTFWALMFGYFANLALPRIGEIARCGALNKTTKLPVDTLIGTVIIERIFDMIVLLILALAIFLIKIEFFGSFIINKILIPTTSQFASVNVLLVIAILFVLIMIVITFFFLLKKENLVTKKITSFIRGMIDGIKSIYELKHRKLFILYTLLLWICYLLMTWIVCLSIQQTESLDIIDGLFLLVIGSIGMAVPVQSGIGVYHYIVAQALTIYNFSFETGLLYATISHESQLIVEILLGIISMLIIFRKQKNHESVR